MNQYLWMNWTYHYRQTAMDCRALNLDPKIYVAHYIKGEFIIILYILRTGLDRLLLHVWPGFFCQIVHESVFLHLVLHLVHSSSGVSIKGQYNSTSMLWVSLWIQLLINVKQDVCDISDSGSFSGRHGDDVSVWCPWRIQN